MEKKQVMSRSNHEEELVKYMSNLPGYLLRADGGVTQQDKALNFGVLDWNRLEKWKHNKESTTRPCERGLEQDKQNNVIEEEGRIEASGSVISNRLFISEEASMNETIREPNVTQQNIVLLLPKDPPRNSCSGLSMNRKMSNPRRSCSSLDDRFPELCSNLTSSSRTNASPHRNQNQLSRSFSLKEDSRNRSRLEDSRGGNRSSPLRRLLDPLLNSKTSGIRRLSDEAPADDVRIKPMIQKNVSPVLRALLQITLKNGLALFKFIVDEKSDILATTAKKVDGSVSDWLYTIYSVREMKKKNIPWMNKSRSNGFLYDAIGQMKISCHDRGEMEIRESVLSSSELSRTEQNSSRELAAMVMEIPKGNVGESSTSVIIPKGVHGLPNEGLPSSLIDRWKSGGSCDCGGWDVGCRFGVLADHSLWKRTSLSSTRFRLFTQGDRGKKPVFSLVPYKNNIYSVDFSLCLSSLQAFSICIAFISSRSCEVPSSRNHTSPGIGEREGPKFVPFPPLSPVGRA